MGAKKIKLFSFSILILFCCLLSGTACGKEKENNEESVPDYEYEYTSKTVRIEEAEAIFMASLQDVVICHREHANYYFDKDLSPEIRNHYVKTSEQVVQFLVDNAGFSSKLEVYAADGMYYYNSENNKCALGSEYAGTSVQAALLIQAASGSATVNYGLLQAEGFSLARLFGWDISYVPPIVTANNEDIAHPLSGKRYEFPEEDKGKAGYLEKAVLDTLKEENQFLLDLEYLCFSPNYVGEEEVEYAWLFARSLSGYISGHSREKEVLSMLMNSQEFFSFEEKFTGLRNAWLLECGSDICVSEKEYPVHYGNYGRFALFRMETLHGKWYVKDGFDNSFGDRDAYSELFRKDYQETDGWMQQFESELTYVDGILRDKTYPYPELNFTLDGSGVAQNGQFDYIAHNQIVIKRAWSIVHEYCHYLLLQDGLFMEGGKFKETYITQLHLLPYYYGSYSKMAYCFFQEYYECLKEEWENDEEWDDILGAFEEKFDGEVSICDTESLELLLHFIVAVNGRSMQLSKIVLRKGSYGHWEENEVVLQSFAIFIAKTYGEDVLYHVATGGNRVEELTGYSYEGLVGEWEKYLDGIYSFEKKME